MKESKTYGEINSSGKLKIFKRDEFMNSLKLIYGNSEAKSIRVEVIVKRLYLKRSNPQNAYLHGIIVNDFINGLKDTTGDIVTHEQAFDLLKYNCNYKEVVNENTGEVMRVPQGTSALSTTEFEEMLDRMRDFIFNWFGITVLLPNEQAEIMFNENE